MPQIRQLPTSVINKIAAGEVIERPASVVKELVENSVDAGASRIDVTIEKGGTELIRVADNGCGIEDKQLELAVTSHATSKIFSAEELFSVSTMGFRGEALASIAEVSQFIIRSRVIESSSGYELMVNGGQRQPIEPCGCPIGTIMEVRNLFFNTPVRRKFLKTPQTETGHITEAFTRIALANPMVHFTLAHNNRVIHELPASENWAQRIGHFFGDEIQQNLIPVSSQHDEILMTGYAVSPTVSRSHNRMQYLFLNGRFIRDRALQHSLTEAYRGLLMTGRFPIVFLQLKMPADQVDVNVHPAKLEVRFLESGRLYSQLLGTLRSRFLSADLTEKVRAAGGAKGLEGQALENARAGLHDSKSGQQLSAMAASFSEPVDQEQAACASNILNQKREAVGAWARGPHQGVTQKTIVISNVAVSNNWTQNLPAQDLSTQDLSGNSDGDESSMLRGGSSDQRGRATSHSSVQPRPSSPATVNRVDSHRLGAFGNLPNVREFQKFPPLAGPTSTARQLSGDDASGFTFSSEVGAEEVPSVGPAATGSELDGVHLDGVHLDSVHLDSVHPSHAKIPTSHIRAANRAIVLQIQNRYLVTESEEGMVVIDQHALHERILYEQVKEKVLAGNLEFQKLLVPQPVDLTPAEAAALLDVKDELIKIGLGVEAFGGSTILITCYPSILATHNIPELIHIIVDQLSQGKQRPDPQDLLEHLLSTIACKAAIKAGNRLSNEEMQALIEHRHLCQDAHHCPHGRPSWLVFSREELDKKFKRI